MRTKGREHLFAGIALAGCLLAASSVWTPKQVQAKEYANAQEAEYDPAGRRAESGEENVSAATIQDGEEFWSGEQRFCVRSAQCHTVALTASTQEMERSVVVPDTVEYQGETFLVTEIDKKVFANRTKLRYVTIGANVVTIGKNAFRGCSALRRVEIRGAVLNHFGKNAWKQARRSCKVSFLGSQTESQKAACYRKMKTAGFCGICR